MTPRGTRLLRHPKLNDPSRPWVREKGREWDRLRGGPRGAGVRPQDHHDFAFTFCVAKTAFGSFKYFANVFSYSPNEALEGLKLNAVRFPRPLW